MTASASVARRTGRTVTAPGGRVNFWVKNTAESIPAGFALLATRAAEKVCIRITGGCKGMDANDKAQMFDYFRAAFAGFRGMVWSGATRQMIGETEFDPMVTDLPEVIVADNPGSIALATAPRTGTFGLVGESSFVLDEHGTAPNPGIAGFLLVQANASDALGWDGDLPDYFGMMGSLAQYGGFSALGLVGWNGGAITKTELTTSASKRWPTFLIHGSGRETDALVDRLVAKDESLANADRFVICERKDPMTLRSGLIAHGFLPGVTA